MVSSVECGYSSLLFRPLILACRFTDYQSTGGPLLLELFPQSKPIRILLLESSQKIATSAAGFEEPCGRRVFRFRTQSRPNACSCERPATSSARLTLIP